MRADITFDDQGYAIKFVQSANGEYELPLSFSLEHLHCYHLIDGALAIDENKIKEQDAINDIANEIRTLKKKLEESDYVIARTFEDIMSLDNTLTFIADFIKILKSFKTKYTDVLANRKAWRERIEELEGSVSAH